MLHTKFHGNRPAGSTVGFLKGYYPIWAWRPSWSCDQHHVINFSLYLKSFIQNFIHNSTIASEEIRFQFFNVHDLGPRSRNDLDLQYSYTFINSIRCLLLPIFRSQASLISEKIHFFHFFIWKSLSYEI